MTPEDEARIDAWVAEKLREPWPLNSAQLAVIRRALGPGSEAAVRAEQRGEDRDD